MPRGQCPRQIHGSRGHAGLPALSSDPRSTHFHQKLTKAENEKNMYECHLFPFSQNQQYGSFLSKWILVSFLLKDI